jgi:hypothetical protein
MTEYEMQVLVTIDGCEVALVPHYDAAKGLSKKYGGYLPMLDMLNLCTLELATDVVFYALRKKDSERDGVREQVHNADLAYLTPHLVRYVIGLMRGGKVPPEKKPVAEAIAEATTPSGDSSVT